MNTRSALLWLYLLLATCSSTTTDNVTESDLADNTSASPEQRTPSSGWSSYVSSSVEKAFTVTAITITAVGSIANGYVLLVLLFTKNSSKNNVNVFIMHQTTLDLTVSMFHFIGLIVNAVSEGINRTTELFVCLIFKTYTISISASHASVCGLVIITVERYVKIVHPVAHRNKYRSWMTRAGIVIPWIFGFGYEFIPTVALTGIVRGQCTRLNLWPKSELRVVWEIAKFLVLYLIPLAVLVFAYCKILTVVHLQRKQVGQNESSMSNAEIIAEKNKRRTEMNVIKTMLLVAMTFVICFCPMRTYTALVQLEAVPRIQSLFYLFSIFHYSSQCINPFIYATQYDVVRRWWKACGQPEIVTTPGEILPEPVQIRKNTKALAVASS